MVGRELAARGFKAVDSDDGWSEPLPDSHQIWREEAMRALLTPRRRRRVTLDGAVPSRASAISGACERGHTRLHRVSGVCCIGLVHVGAVL
jgi:hypothetical protein